MTARQLAVEGIVLIDKKILLLAQDGKRKDTSQQVAHYYLPRAPSVDELVLTLNHAGAFPQFLTKGGEEYFGEPAGAEPLAVDARTGVRTYIMTASTSLFEPHCTRYRPGKLTNKNIMEPGMLELYRFLQTDERFGRYLRGGRITTYVNR